MKISVALMMVLTSPLAAAVVPALTVYDNQLDNGFNDRSWSTSYSLANTTPVHAGTHSISFNAKNYEGIQLDADNIEFNAIDYQSATFWLNGGSGGGQALTLYLSDNYQTLRSTYDIATLVPNGVIPKNAWVQVTLDFDAIGLVSGTFNGIVIQDRSGAAAAQPTVYIDDIVFMPRTTAPPSTVVNVSVDLTSHVHPFSSDIFGVAGGDFTRNQQMGYTVARWGGNSVTRYNWQANVYNTAADYYYENIPNCNAAFCPPGLPRADNFITAAFAAGMRPLITIPTIGWTARADSPQAHPYFSGFSISKYGAQTAKDPYDTNAGNGVLSSGGNVTGNAASDTSSSAPASFEASWVMHLTTTYGSAASGGVALYALDNEVMLWNSTHRDVHPLPPTYDEIWSKTLAYATAIKQQDGDALVTGPVTWGYPDLFTSAKDAAVAAPGCNCSDGVDRQAHGDTPFVAWYLQQVCANPLPGGKRLVDYLDLHYYPQGSNVALSDDDSGTTAGLRLRSLKELYDSTWASQSWIGGLGDNDSNHYSKPNLIPRVKAWINSYCPGTKLAITEYNWGNDGTSSGALAQAELFGIFAREGVDLATRWVAPAANTKAELAFSIFLNYDGAGSRVQGDSVAATSANVDLLGAYAFHLADTLTNSRTMLLLTNKDTANHDAALTFDGPHVATWTLYGFDSSNTLRQTGTGSINGKTLTLPALPAMSASLLVIPDSDDIFKAGFE